MEKTERTRAITLVKIANRAAVISATLLREYYASETDSPEQAELLRLQGEAKTLSDSLQSFIAHKITMRDNGNGHAS